MKGAAVIPCFNEGRTIAPLVAALKEYFPFILVVDDGSQDETASAARNAGAEVIRHERNLGKGAAMQNGLARLVNLDFEWAVTLDGDGQHDPGDLPAFFQCAERTRAPLIVGNRMMKAEAMPWVRRQVNRWMSRKLSEYSGQLLPDTQCGFRLIHLPAWAKLRLKSRHFEIESEMLMAFLAAQYRVEFVPIGVHATTRKSRIHPFRDTVHWWRWWWSMKREAQLHGAVFAGPLPKRDDLFVRTSSPFP